MPVFEVSNRTVKPSGPPRKRSSRARRRWFAVLRYVQAISIVGGTFALVLLLVQTRLVFILLPAGVSVVTGIIIGRTKLNQLKALLLTICLAILYFASVTGWEMLTHSDTTPEIIIVTTTLTIAVILEPVRSLVQSYFERRFHLREDAASRAVAAFTSTLREEIDLDVIRERFLDVAQKTMRPQTVSVWVRGSAPEETGSLRSQAATPPPDATHPSDATALAQPAQPAPGTATSQVTIAEADPFLAYALDHPGVIDLDTLRLDSPIIQQLRADSVELVLPLASEGDLLGLLTLGPRLGGRSHILPIPGALTLSILGLLILGPYVNGQDYTPEDRDLLATLAAQMAPAVRVAQLVQVQQAQVRERERIDQELRTARQIQRTFLPKEVPEPPGWRLVPYYQPAREVGGDFYDFHVLQDGRLGVVLGDVTGKGIPAALVMTAARTMLRTAAQEDAAPGNVFARVNDLLCADVPPGVFVTCFYALLEPTSGHVRFVNSGQDLPYLRHANGTLAELHATGMPLGLMPGTHYDEGEATLAPGDSLLFFSDGLVEAHNPEREMFGLRRVAQLVEQRPGDQALIAELLHELRTFTGSGWEQEDDVTLVSVYRFPPAESKGLDVSDDSDDSTNLPVPMTPPGGGAPDSANRSDSDPTWRSLGEWSLVSQPGNEREAIRLVASAVRDLHLSPLRLERLKTAVGEATMNAMEHGNRYQPDLPVTLRVLASASVSGSALSVRITDEGGNFSLTPPEPPDLGAKLAGLQSPRGWGLFLIERLVDEVHVGGDESHRTIELILRLNDDDAPSPSPAPDTPGP